MAINAIEIIQDNIVDEVNLLSAHNPLVFIAKATWSGDAPTTIYCNVIFDGNFSNSDQYRGIYLEDVSETERTFMFISDEAVRLRLPIVEDISQSSGTIIGIPNITQALTININNGVSTSDEVDIIAANVARDFTNEQGAALVDLQRNEQKYYVGAVGQQSYLYWWNNNASNLIRSAVTPSTITITFNANPSDGDELYMWWTRQYIEDNPNCIYPELQRTLVFGSDIGKIPIGVDISETIDNTIAFMGSMNKAWSCMEYERVSNDLIITDPTFFYNKLLTAGNTAPVTYNFENQISFWAAIEISLILNLNDGEFIYFDYTDRDGVTTSTAMRAKNSPGGANDFQIGLDADETLANYYNALLLAYPALTNLFNNLETSGGDRVQLQSYNFNESFTNASSTGAATLTVTNEQIPPEAVQLPVGFVRRAITPITAGITEENILIEDNAYKHTFKVRPWCDNDIKLKYLDRNGQYRFVFCNQYYSISETPKSLGDIDNIIKSIADDKGDKTKIGYSNNQTYTLKASQLNIQERELLGDLYNSPEVYLMLENKEVLVEVQGDNIRKLSKNKFGDVSITVKLPKSYNISRL